MQTWRMLAAAAIAAIPAAAVLAEADGTGVDTEQPACLAEPERGQEILRRLAASAPADAYALAEILRDLAPPCPSAPREAD